MRGFSLVELAIVVAIIAVLAFAFLVSPRTDELRATAFLHDVRGGDWSGDRLEARNDGTHLLKGTNYACIRDEKSAIWVLVPMSGSGRIVTLESNTIDYSSLDAPADIVLSTIAATEATAALRAAQATRAREGAARDAIIIIAATVVAVVLVTLIALFFGFPAITVARLAIVTAIVGVVVAALRLSA